jgi:hypothetical protein
LGESLLELVKSAVRVLIGKYRYFEIFGTLVRAIENLIAPFDRAYRVLVEPRIGDLDQVVGRIVAGITRISC